MTDVSETDIEIQKDKWFFKATPGAVLSESQKRQKAYLRRMKKINKTPRRMKKGKNRHIRCDQGKPTGRQTPWALALNRAKLELEIPLKGVMVFPRVGTDLHTVALKHMREIQAQKKDDNTLSAQKE